MASQAERIGVVETKVANIETKIDELKDDVKASNTEIKEQLKTMYEASCEQHASLAKKLSEVEKFKDKWLLIMAIVGPIVAYVAAHIDWKKLF